MKKIIIVSTMLLLSTQIFCKTYFNSDEEVSVVLTVNDNSLSDYYDSKSYDSISEFLVSSEGELYENNIILNQERIINDIKKNVDVEYEGNETLINNTIYLSVKKSDINLIKHDSVNTVELSTKFEVTSLGDSYNHDALNIAYEVNKNGIYDSSWSDNDGEGMLIGIIDSGIDPNHDAFSKMPNLNTAKYTSEQYLTSDMLSKLNATGTAKDLYLSDKIVFAYDYVGNDNNVLQQNQGYHGYHVAGIAAGNNGSTFTGASPEAQLAMFKIFGDADSNGNFSGSGQNSITRAIEDAIIIGCDVINMSIGSVSNYNENSTYYTTIENARQLGVSVVVSNGNSATSTGNYGTSDMMEYGASCSPGSTQGALAVGNSLKTLTAMNVESSWGTLANMEIKPDISAPGTDVYSAWNPESTTAAQTTGYTNMNGTSMSAPNIAGILANSIQYIKNSPNQFGELTDYEALCLAESMLMSTAIPITYEDTHISPRHQGSGIGSLVQLEKTQAYLTTIDNTKPKITLGDDSERTGVFEFSFLIHNFSEERLFMTFSNSTSTDEVDGNSLTYNPYKLDPTINYYENGNLISNVKLNGESVTEIKVVIELSENDMNYINDNFLNGSYVDGRVFIHSNDTQLTIPYVGFFGGWDEANPFYSEGTGSALVEYNYMLDEELITSNLGEYNLNYNIRDFDDNSEVEFLSSQDNKRNSINLNNDKNKLTTLSFRVVREVKDMNISVVNLTTGETISSNSVSYNKWTVEGSNYQTYNIDLDLKDLNFNNNTVLGIVFSGKLSYFTDDYSKYIVPIVVDNEAPTITNMSYENNDLSFSTIDNHYLQGYNIVSSNGETLYDNYIPFFDTQKANKINIENIDTSKLNGDLYLKVVDYAGNISTVALDDIIDDSLYYDDIVTKLTNFDTTSFTPTEEIGTTFTKGNATYFVTKYGYILTSYKDSSKEKEYEILYGTISIASNAFDSKYLTSVTIAQTVLSIQDEAFINCENLENVVFKSLSAPSLVGNNIFNQNLTLTVMQYNEGYNGLEYKKVFSSITVIDCELIDLGNNKALVYIDNEVESNLVRNTIIVVSIVGTISLIGVVTVVILKKKK